MREFRDVPDDFVNNMLRPLDISASAGPTAIASVRHNPMLLEPGKKARFYWV
jgi:hypothetical protein